MKTLGAKLRDLREARNLSQKEVSQHLMISNKLLSSYERDINDPPYPILKQICEYYNVSADYLLDIDIKESLEDDASHSELIALNPTQKRILAYYSRLNQEHRDAIRGLMVLYYKEQTRDGESRPDKNSCVDE